MKFMKKNKKHTGNWRTLTALCLALLLSLTACGGGNSEGGNSDSPVDSDTESSGQNEEAEKTEDEKTDKTAETSLPVATLEESEAWLLYSDGSYAEVLVHVPEGKVSAQACLKDGTDINVDGERLFWGTRKLSPGWCLMVTNKIPDENTMNNLAVKLTWEDGEQNADGTYPSVLIAELGGQRTADDLRASGMVVWDDHYGAMLEARTTYGSGSSTDLNDPSFGLFFELYFYGSDMNVLPEDLSDQLTFFAGDGTPLENYFEGFDSIAIEINTVSVYALLYRSDGAPYDETKYKEMCDELRACEPYMVFTGKDGTTQKYTIFQD